MADVGVRPATDRDVDDIARVQLVTWRAAYAGLLPAHVLADLTQAGVATAWATAVTEPPTGRHRVLVAVEGPVVVGFAASEPSADDDLDPQLTGAVTTLLVEPRWGRRGHGSRLLAAATDLLRADGSMTAVTWLPAADRASRTFFSSAGWAPDGAGRTLEAGGRLLDEVRLHSSLRVEAAPGEAPQPAQPWWTAQ